MKWTTMIRIPFILHHDTADSPCSHLLLNYLYSFSINILNSYINFFFDAESWIFPCLCWNNGCFSISRGSALCADYLFSDDFDGYVNYLSFLL